MQAPAAKGPIWQPPFYFCVALFATLLGSLYEVCLRQPAAFAKSSIHAQPAWITTAGFAALLLAMAVTWRSRWRPSLARWLLGSALAVGCSSPLLFASFCSQYQRLLSFAVPVGAGACLGITLFAARAACGKVWRQLGLWPHLLHPLRLLLFLLALLGAANLAPLIGLLRSALVAALLLAWLGFWYVRLHAYLYQRALPNGARIRFAAAIGAVACSAAFVLSERWVSRQQLGYFHSAVVFTQRSERSELVVTSGPGGLQLFVDRSLRMADIDGHRYYEALVHPAFGLVERPRHVLVLGGAEGFVEREVLAYGSVKRLVVVTDDLGVARLARNAPWLRQRTNDAMNSPKLELIQAEPIVWLTQTSESFDVIVVDLPDPSTPRWGKNFTRYFYGRVAAHLALSGVAAIQAGALLRCPRTFANIERSVQSAGLSTTPYHAALPSLGDWGFLLAGRHVSAPTKLHVNGTRFVSNRSLSALFAIPRDSRATAGAPSMLYDQRVVRLFNEERSRRLKRR